MFLYCGRRELLRSPIKCCYFNNFLVIWDCRVQTISLQTEYLSTRGKNDWGMLHNRVSLMNGLKPSLLFSNLGAVFPEDPSSDYLRYLRQVMKVWKHLIRRSLSFSRVITVFTFLQIWTGRGTILEIMSSVSLSKTREDYWELPLSARGFYVLQAFHWWNTDGSSYCIIMNRHRS